LFEIKDLSIAPGLCHFHAMLEYWNNVLKTYKFSVRIKVFGINFHYLSMIESYLPNFDLFAFFEEIQST